MYVPGRTDASATKLIKVRQLRAVAMEGTGETDSLTEEGGFKPWVPLADWWGLRASYVKYSVIVQRLLHLPEAVPAGTGRRRVNLDRCRRPPSRCVRHPGPPESSSLLPQRPVLFLARKREGAGLDDTSAAQRNCGSGG